MVVDCFKKITKQMFSLKRISQTLFIQQICMKQWLTFKLLSPKFGEQNNHVIAFTFE